MPSIVAARDPTDEGEHRFGAMAAIAHLLQGLGLRLSPSGFKGLFGVVFREESLSMLKLGYRRYMA